MAELFIADEELNEFMSEHPFFKGKEIENVKYLKNSQRLVMKYSKKIPRVENNGD